MSISTSVPGTKRPDAAGMAGDLGHRAGAAVHPFAAVAGGDGRREVLRCGACGFEDFLARPRNRLGVTRAGRHDRPGQQPLLVIDERGIARQAANVHTEVEHRRSPGQRGWRRRPHAG